MDYNVLIRPEFVVIALFVNALGAILKYRTPLNNKLLPLVLFAVAFVICAVWGWFSSVYAGGARWADSLLIAGLVHGGVVTSIAVFGWDAIYGVYKHGLGKKKEKKR
jgi:Kef-type K+ transport system membrane component KefB